MAKKPRVKLPKKAKAGDVIQVKTLARHKMETGNRKDKKGNKIPRLILNKFECKFGGETVFSADMYPSVSADPYIAFYLTATASGTYEFVWTDDNGKAMSVSQDIAVS
ncbi:thiosulfate oxidation carrier complex protein SoxZ [Magnetovibrio sp. PR-2]|uniref:thiosulfate oxidation carrier complex protein SoxZ n=1 Tax=Magnetovibrio sp. PR-2 TaxID=3120356 RepID=UPI002FCE2E21